MSLLFRYKLLPTNRPVVSLDGRLVRPRPLIVVALVGPAGTIAEAAHLDPGSDDCVFPTFWAKQIGVDLGNAPEGEAAGVGQAPVSMKYAKVTLRLASGAECCEWPAWVAFTDATLRHPLLGFAGFLQFFTASFRGEDEEVELTINGLYPGATL